MTKTIQLLRGTTAQNAAFTGASGEVTVDTQTHELRVHDGSTVGGHIIYTKSDVDTALSSKADVATTLSGYGITDAYTTTEVDTALATKANTDLSNLTSTGKANVSKQGTYDSGETYSAGTIGEAIQNKANVALDNLTSAGVGKLGPQVYQVIGYVVNSATAGSPVAAYGICRVELYPNGLAIVDFNLRFTASGTSGDFNWGLNRDVLHTLNANIPIITPIGGTCSYYDANGIYSDNLNGYSGTLTGYNQFWTFGRLYDAAGNIGGWGASQMSLNIKVVGRCYGTYTV